MTSILVFANIVVGELMKCDCNDHRKITLLLSEDENYSTKVSELSNIFSLLGEPNRMKILLALMQGELCVYHLCEITGGKQSAISQHLRKLKDGNILKARKSGNLVLYSIIDEHVRDIVLTSIKHLDCK